METAQLSTLSGRVAAGKGYCLDIEPGEYLVFHARYIATGAAGASFSHPNITRTRTRVEELKYGHRDWRKKTVTTHILIVPRSAVTVLLQEFNLTYPHILVGGEEITISTSGGTSGGDWTDRIATEVHVNGLPVKTLSALASAAVRNTPLEPYRFFDEQQADFYAQHANDWLAIAGFGSWHEDVPAGMVGVVASLGGLRHSLDPAYQEREFLVPVAEYRTSGALPFVVDPVRHASWATRG